ncbi:MAG: hypothetical protein IBX43_01640 [Campylobacterales bacterium]|nr:hypothetical protein [Campylobacterales bacterium]
MQEHTIKKDIEIAWPSKDAARLANAIYHTYTLDEYKELELEVPMSRVCQLFGLEVNEASVRFISSLVDEILGEPIAVMNKVVDHKLIRWKTYELFTLLEPIGPKSEVIKLKINTEYLRITKEFVINPFLEL